MANGPFYRRFDRAVSQQRVGPHSADAQGNHRSLQLNERGPALKVFWIPGGPGLGAGPVRLRACLQGAFLVREKMIKKRRARRSQEGRVLGPCSFWFELEVKQASVPTR